MNDSTIEKFDEKEVIFGRRRAYRMKIRLNQLEQPLVMVRDLPWLLLSFYQDAFFAMKCFAVFRTVFSRSD